MKRLALVLLLLLPAFVGAQEIVTLTTPESNATYHVASFALDVDAGVLNILLKGVNGEIVSCTYTSATTPTGATLITGLNKANLASVYAANATTGSLKQRIAHRLIVMGESTAVCGKTLTGTLAGTVP